MAIAPHHVVRLFLLVFFSWAIFFTHPTSFTRDSDPLVTEIDRLKAPEGSTHFSPCSYRAKSDGNRLYSCLYRNDSSYSELVTFYSAQLQANGWRKAGEEKLFNWFRDLGGREAFFCKDRLQISLQVAGAKESFGWRYALDASVGIPPYYCAAR